MADKKFTAGDWVYIEPKEAARIPEKTLAKIAEANRKLPVGTRLGVAVDIPLITNMQAIEQMLSKCRNFYTVEPLAVVDFGVATDQIDHLVCINRDMNFLVKAEEILESDGQEFRNGYGKKLSRSAKDLTVQRMKSNAGVYENICKLVEVFKEMGESVLAQNKVLHDTFIQSHA